MEFSGVHSTESSVIQIVFLKGQARLVTLTEDNTLHLWEIGTGSRLVEKKSTQLEGRLKKISVLCVDPLKRKVYLGTEGGNIYQLALGKFSVPAEEGGIIYQDLVMKGAPDDFKVNPGAVEALLVQPNEPGRILIGYARGLIVLWDVEKQV